MAIRKMPILHRLKLVHLGEKVQVATTGGAQWQPANQSVFARHKIVNSGNCEVTCSEFESPRFTEGRLPSTGG
ncbi:hypothetical protein HAX54_046616, partial [Datura stramonium]|nr:hypothetical protein [Datura stramonium]